MDELAIFNSLEAIFWMTVGVIVFWKSRTIGHEARMGIITAVWFFLFGISDIFEAFTGAWWRPWPLMAMKGTCILALLICGIIYRRNTLNGP